MELENQKMKHWKLKMKSDNPFLRNAHPQKERGRESSTKRESFRWKCSRLPLELAEDRTLFTNFVFS